MSKRNLIEKQTGVMCGKPVIKGTRITVEHILKRLRAGWTEGQLIESYPHLKPEQIRLCQAFLELVPRDEIGPWFEKANPAFNGLKPLEVIERGEVDRIWNMIFELRAGNHA